MNVRLNKRCTAEAAAWTVGFSDPTAGTHDVPQRPPHPRSKDQGYQTAPRPERLYKPPPVLAAPSPLAVAGTGSLRLLRPLSLTHTRTTLRPAATP